MRIAILADALDLQQAGVHVYVRELVKALTKAKGEHEYLLVRPKPGGEFKNAKEIIIPVRAGLPGSQRLRLFTSIPRRLAQEKADIVVEPAHFGPFNLPAGVKRVTVIHDLTPILFPQFHPFASVLSHRLLLPGILKRADAIIANSQHTRKDIEEKYPFAKGKTHVVLPGLESGFAPRHDAAILEKYGIRQPYFLCVGTLEPRKNLVNLLEAYHDFRQQAGQEFQLVLTGGKGWKNKLFFEALAKSPFQKDIILTGYAERSHLPVLYSMAALFIYPSWYEGFGLPVLEAMACGAPVLISDAASLPEVGSVAARYFSPDAVADLAVQLSALAFDEKKRLDMSRLSLVVAKRFSWERAAAQFMEVLKSL